MQLALIKGAAPFEDHDRYRRVWDGQKGGDHFGVLECGGHPVALQPILSKINRPRNIKSERERLTALRGGRSRQKRQRPGCERGP